MLMEMGEQSQAILNLVLLGLSWLHFQNHPPAPAILTHPEMLDSEGVAQYT